MRLTWWRPPITWGGLWMLGLLMLTVIGASLRAYQQAIQARFAVDVLEAYLHYYAAMKGRPVISLDELPDFDVVAPSQSLRVRLRDIREGLHGGYVYDVTLEPDGTYVVNASPTGILPGVEFGITEDGVLHGNTEGVDASADSREEIASWPEVPRFSDYRSRRLPDYLRR